MAARRQDSWDTLQHHYTSTPPSPPSRSPPPAPPAQPPPPSTQAQLQTPATTTNYSAIADFLWIGRRSRSISPQFIPPLISDDQVQLDTLQTIEVKLDKHLAKLSPSADNVDPTCTAASATTICHNAEVLSPSPHPSQPPPPPPPPPPATKNSNRIIMEDHLFLENSSSLQLQSMRYTETELELSSARQSKFLCSVSTSTVPLPRVAFLTRSQKQQHARSSKTTSIDQKQHNSPVQMVFGRRQSGVHLRKGEWSASLRKN